jgi:hypothetical protein
VAVVDGECLLKRLDLSGGIPSDLCQCGPFGLRDGRDGNALMWGVVTWNLDRLRAR